MPDPFAIAGLNDALKDIQGAQKHGNENLRLLGVILSGVDARTRLAKSLTAYVKDIFTADGIPSMKFESEVSRSTVVPRAQRVGKTLFQTAPKHKITEQYRAIAKEIEERIRKFSSSSSSVSETVDRKSKASAPVGEGEENVVAISDRKEVANG